MSDIIHHECGVAFIRLLKPLEYYKTKYGSARYGLHKLYQVMEKSTENGIIRIQDGTQGPLSEAMEKDLPEVENAVTVMNLSKASVAVSSLPTVPSKEHT